VSSLTDQLETRVKAAQDRFALAKLKDEITALLASAEFLPCLNALAKNAVYTPEAQKLNLRIDTGLISLVPREMSVGQVTCDEDGTKIVDDVKGLIDDTWEGRTIFTSTCKRKGETKAKDIIGFLPGTNCHDCELPTCVAFTVALLKRQKRLQGCSSLSTGTCQAQGCAG